MDERIEELQEWFKVTKMKLKLNSLSERMTADIMDLVDKRFKAGDNWERMYEHCTNNYQKFRVNRRTNGAVWLCNGYKMVRDKMWSINRKWKRKNPTA